MLATFSKCFNFYPCYFLWIRKPWMLLSKTELSAKPPVNNFRKSSCSVMQTSLRIPLPTNGRATLCPLFPHETWWLSYYHHFNWPLRTSCQHLPERHLCNQVTKQKGRDTNTNKSFGYLQFIINCKKIKRGNSVLKGCSH